MHDALACASIDPTRLILNSAYLDVSKRGAHYVVGTDGHHLFSSNSFNLPLPESLIVPSHPFFGWKGFNEDGDWRLRVKKPEKKEDAEVIEDWHFETDPSACPDGWEIWLHSSSGGIDAVCAFIQHLLQRFAPGDPVTLEWSNDCSKPEWMRSAEVPRLSRRGESRPSNSNQKGNHPMNNLLDVLTREGVLINVSVRYWRGCKKLRPEDIGLKADAASDRLISLGHKRLPKSEIIVFRRVFRSPLR